LRGRLTFIILSLFVVLLAAIFFLVLTANRRNALRQINAGLERGRGYFVTLKDRRIEELNKQARLLAFDYAFKQAFGTSANDPATMRLAMRNGRDRVSASFFTLVSLEHQVLFDTENPERDGTPFDLPGVITAAERAEEEAEDGETRGLKRTPVQTVALRNGQLFAIVVVPLLAPDPKAWICLGFPIDNDFARELGDVTGQEVSFLEQNEEWKIVATTLGAEDGKALAQAMNREPLPLDRTERVDLANGQFVSLLKPLEVPKGRAAVVLQRNLDTELAPFRKLERILLVVAFAGLAVSALVAFGFARTVARPVLRLAHNARRIEQGDYSARADADVQRPDEIGQLAQSFQKMTEGLAERDLVRDLLGKVASPAIAAELLRRQATLGGEERCVTVLFSDLQGFSTIAERFPAGEVVAILNAYFTRMSEIVDAHGGVVDKFIGDGVMALFGAPVDQPDHAARALAAALEMTAALDVLNEQGFAKEVIQHGIGIHTDEIVAGIMGSPERHNYTVIGDGVNIASRLQALTRIDEYETRVIISDATLRAAGPGFQTRSLGEVTVRGRARPIIIHALHGHVRANSDTRAGAID
ncbi:MAG TPA: adenylate/guanylate cyclase domain-containing protein, partial [Chthoniobacteraceae bacterium]|nr:adenylate/guanylate cyclase domain-containing protein [Chthoniobacteraceae bacterium]